MIDFAFAWAILWIFRTRDKMVPSTAVVDRSFTPEIEAFLQTIPWWRSFRLWSLLLVLCVAALYIRFF